jgi:hypothetical protein
MDEEPIKGGARRRALGYSADGIDWVNDCLLDNDDDMIGGKGFFKKIGKDISKSNKKLSKGFSKVATAVNPMTYVTKSGEKLMGSLGDVTHDYILPSVVAVGKPVLDATAEVASTALTGNPVLGKALVDTAWKKMVVDKGADPRANQKSALLGKVSGVAGDAIAEGVSAGMRRRAGSRASQIVSAIEAKDLINTHKMKNPSRWLKDKYGHYVEPRHEELVEAQPSGVAKAKMVVARKLVEAQPSTVAKAKMVVARKLVEAQPSGVAKAKMVIAPRMAEQFIDQYQQAEDYDQQQEEEQTPAKKKYVRPQRGVKGARGKRGAQKKDKMTVEEQQASRKATLARERAKTISLSSEIRDVVKAIPTMNYLELMALKPTLIRFNNAERTKAEDNNLEKLKKAFNKRGEELKKGNQGRTQGMALARARDISDDDEVIEGFGRGKGLTNKIVKHLDKDNKEMKKLSKAFKRHMDTEEATK